MPKLLLYRPSVGSGSAGGVEDGGSAGLDGSAGSRPGGHNRGCHGRARNEAGWVAFSAARIATGGEDGVVWAAQGITNPTTATGPVKIHDNFFIGTPFPSGKKRAIRPEARGYSGFS
jgi:hypothetical protein